ncbi:MAG TPA: hypothetical protein VN616_03840 [Puia sp.]|nr:hypothetical protein [Puia sp.]
MPGIVTTFHRRYFPVVLILVLACGYLAYLVSTIHLGIFYSADGGVKYMTVKQLAAGEGFKYVHLSQPSWVRSIWQAGFFPLRPPFVYPSPDGYMYVFPPAYQVVNAFLYAWLGYAGLYVIPIACTVLLWVLMALLLRRIGIRPGRIAIALFLLAFCSPLTMYGAMYWEHGPATLLLFAGLYFIARPPSRVAGAIALGLISGLAIWLRPEAIVLNFLYALAVIVLFRQERRPVYIAFLACLLASVVAFVGFNLAEYGSILGIHGQQLLDPGDMDDHLGLTKSLYNVAMTNYKSIRNFGFVLLLLPVAYRLCIGKGKADPRPGLLAAVVLVFSLVTPLMMPNDGGRQWGVRYFLPLIPIVIVVLCLADRQWGILDGRYRLPRWLAAFVLLVTAYSFYHNSFSGGVRDLRWSYMRRVRPYLQRFEQKDGNVVVVSDAYMVYELGYLFDRDYFFLAEGDDSLRRLLPLLKAKGVREYTYIFNPRNPASQPSSLRDATTRQLWPLAAKRKIRDEFYCRTYAL